MLFVVAILFMSANTTINAQIVLNYEDYLQQVFIDHPTAQRADLLKQIANAQLTIAKGGFDPKFLSAWNGKRYNDKIYYSLFDNELKIPMPFGADIKVAYQWAGGYNINPENNLPLAGLGTLGINLPILQGLAIDDRRANLQQAKLLKNINQNEQLLILNDLLFAAAIAYWDWFEAHQHLQVTQKALLLAQTRLSDLKNSVQQGERPGIDTIEARLIAQERQLQLQDNMLYFELSKINLQNFLWNRKNIENQTILPTLIDTSITPIVEISNNNNNNDKRYTIDQQHPILQSYQYKINSLNIERKLKANKLLPKLNLQYNLLAKQFNYWNDEGYGIPIVNNIKWEVSAAFPLFFRQEHGNLSLIQLKIKDAEFQTIQKQTELNNKVNAQISKINNLVQQIRLYEQSIRDYQTLLDAENMRFKLGESSVFLINTRESKLVEAQQKMILLKTKYLRARVELEWVKGNMVEQLIEK